MFKKKKRFIYQIVIHKRNKNLNKNLIIFIPP